MCVFLCVWERGCVGLLVVGVRMFVCTCKGVYVVSISLLFFISPMRLFSYQFV